MIENRFLVLYKQVFNNDGGVKLCGRDVCKELILLSNQIEPSVNHGNVNTGFIEIKAIRNVYKRICGG